MIVTNSFSLNMLSVMDGIWNITVLPIDIEHAKVILETGKGVESAVGHADTAAIFSTILGLEVPMIRRTLSLARHSTILVGQYRGPRMTEGAKTLPDGATIEWLLVTVA